MSENVSTTKSTASKNDDPRLVALEIEEKQIEVEKARQLLKWEVRKAQAEAEKEERQALVSGISARKAEREEFDKINSDERHYTYWFDEDVNSRSAKNCINTLRRWDREDPEAPITIIFNSPGGSVIDGMALFDEITALSLRGGGKHKITGKVRGYAASMAGILLQATDVRVCGPESYVMVHEVSAGAGGKIGEIEDRVEFLKLMSARIAKLFVARSNGKLTDETFSALWTRRDAWCASDYALEIGLVDAIG